MSWTTERLAIVWGKYGHIMQLFAAKGGDNQCGLAGREWEGRGWRTYLLMQCIESTVALIYDPCDCGGTPNLDFVYLQGNRLVLGHNKSIPSIPCKYFLERIVPCMVSCPGPCWNE